MFSILNAALIDDASAEEAYIRGVMPGYFQAMGIPLVAGRVIEENDRLGASPVIVINETLSRSIFPDSSPIGRKVVIDNPDGPFVAAEVIGVVGDVRMEGSGLRRTAC
jgi:hypothetical protein